MSGEGAEDLPAAGAAALERRDLLALPFDQQAGHRDDE